MRYVYLSIALSSLVLNLLIPRALADEPASRSPSSISSPELKNAIFHASHSPVASSGAFLPTGERLVQPTGQVRPSTQAMADVNSNLSSFPPIAARVRTQNWDE